MQNLTLVNAMRVGLQSDIDHQKQFVNQQANNNGIQDSTQSSQNQKNGVRISRRGETKKRMSFENFLNDKNKLRNQQNRHKKLPLRSKLPQYTKSKQPVSKKGNKNTKNELYQMGSSRVKNKEIGSSLQPDIPELGDIQASPKGKDTSQLAYDNTVPFILIKEEIAHSEYFTDEQPYMDRPNLQITKDDEKELKKSENNKDRNFTLIKQPSIEQYVKEPGLKNLVSNTQQNNSEVFKSQFYTPQTSSNNLPNDQQQYCPKTIRGLFKRELYGDANSSDKKEKQLQMKLELEQQMFEKKQRSIQEQQRRKLEEQKEEERIIRDFELNKEREQKQKEKEIELQRQQEIRMQFQAEQLKKFQNSALEEKKRFSRKKSISRIVSEPDIELPVLQPFNNIDEVPELSEPPFEDSDLSHVQREDTEQEETNSEPEMDTEREQRAMLAGSPPSDQNWRQTKPESRQTREIPDYPVRKRKTSIKPPSEQGINIFYF